MDNTLNYLEWYLDKGVTPMQIEDYQPSAPAPARVEHAENNSTLVYVRKLRQPPERVWTALTDAEQLPKWAPYRPSRNLTETGDVTLNMIDGSTPEVYESEVKEVIANEVLEYSWGKACCVGNWLPTNPAQHSHCVIASKIQNGLLRRRQAGTCAWIWLKS